MVDVTAQLGKVVGERFKPGLNVLSILLGFTPGINCDSARGNEIDLRPVFCGWQLARRDGMPDDKEPYWAKHPVDKHILSVTETAVGFRYDKTDTGTTNLGGIAGKLVRQQA